MKTLYQDYTYAIESYIQLVIKMTKNDNIKRWMIEENFLVLLDR